MDLTSRERWQLDSFRRAAREIRDASIIAEGRTIDLKIVPTDDGYANIFVNLLNNEQFRSLALAIRLVYQNNEAANFYSVYNLLFRSVSEDVRQHLADLRAAYSAALSNASNSVHIGDGSDPDPYTAREVLEHWLYGVTFHQEENRQYHVQRLASVGPRFKWSIQETSLQLAGRIIDVDDVIADYLGEDRVPRIGEPRPTA